MLKILATLPISSCEPERIFSKVEHTMTAIRASMSEERLEALIVAKPGVSKWGLRGGYGRGVPLPLGARGCAPGKKFSNYRCTQVSFSTFSDKNQYIYACKLW
jgi:hypothetical protein